MVSDRSDVVRGSWRWTLRIAEITAWSTAAFIFLLLHVTELPSRNYRWGLGLVGALVVWLFVLFRMFVKNRRADGWGAVFSIVLNLGFATAAHYLLRESVLSTEVIFVPVIVVTGLLTPLVFGIAAAALASVSYWGVAELEGNAPDLVQGLLTAGMFVLSATFAGLLARELRTHYRGEQEEHRLATAVRHRLLAVLDAVDEAVIFRDRQGMTRVVNSRAGELFQVKPDAMLGAPVVELLRSIARQTEDPEGFMEVFQELRDDPDLEIRRSIEQIIPERRVLRLYSGPTYDETGALVGRIDVYTDITESERRAAEIESLYETTRTIAESYQRSLLPDSVPTLPRVSMVANYLPAAGKRAVCGDFYDFVLLQDGRVGFVLGDVCGAGPISASDAALARYTLRSIAASEPDPQKLLGWMNNYLGEQLTSERFVRLVYAVLDPERATLEYASAGHVPPVVYRAKRKEVDWLGEGGIALGIERDAEYKTGRIELDPGDLLVFYTDGVTEAPRDGRPFGQGKFSDIVSEFGIGSPGELVQAIRRAVEAWVGEGELRDDLALLVTQIVPDTAIDELVRELVLPNEPARMSEVRAFVTAFLADVRGPVDVAHEILLAASEAAANACRHGRRAGGRSEIRVRCKLERKQVTIEVADEGEGFDSSKIEAPDLPDRFASGGRGLYLMRELSDAVDITSTDKGTTVRLTRRVHQ